MISREVELAVDECLLDSCESNRLKVEALLSVSPLSKDTKSLIRSICDDDPLDVRLVPSETSSYLLSRLTLRGWQPAGNPTQWLYALADSVRGLDTIGIHRLRFVVSKINLLDHSASAVRTLQQSGRALAALSALSPDERRHSAGKLG